MFIFITEIRVGINTNLKCFFKENLLQYQIMHSSLQDFICKEHRACHHNLLKRTKCQYFDNPPRSSETIPDDVRVPETVHKRSIMRVCWITFLSPECNIYKTFLHWS